MIVNQRPFILWLTGLPASGKTTIAIHLQRVLNLFSIPVIILDGDDVRKTINRDLSFSLEDRTKNIERVKHIIELIIKSRISTICAFVSPLEKHRNMIKEQFPSLFILAYVSCPLEICKQRDPKKLYRNNPGNLTGVSQKYETPTNPDIIIHTDRYSVDDCIKQLIELLIGRNFI